MNSEIILRPYQKTDAKAVRQMIREAWHYDEFVGPKTADKMAHVFLLSCLANQTFIRVAARGNTSVGIIMGKNIRSFKLSPILWLKRSFSILSLILSKEGRRVSGLFGNVNAVDEELLQNAGREYQGEVALFVVASAARGKGTGKQLFQSLLAYMKEEQLENFFLFTDTSCNYQFYERQGMNRRGEKQQTVHVQGQEAKMSFFLYDYALS